MGTGHIRSLALGNTTSKQLRKYLGDPTDPHFVPQSPIIERQKLTAQEEDELSRLCSLALENVPHSDGDLDDPFRYLASQITVKQDQPSQQQEGRKASNHGLGHIAMIGTFPPHGAETATPSETSKRETLQTDATTPMTTPGETGNRFSDVGKRPVTAQPSNGKAGSKPVKANMLYSFLNEPLPTRPSLVPAASKSMTNLPNLNKERSQHHRPDQIQHSDPLSIVRPDFNKSLPAIPRFMTGQEEQPKVKPNTITRMLKTVRLHRTQTSMDAPPRSTCTDTTNRQKELLQKQVPKKNRFNPFTFLQKRTSINTKRATVG